MFCAGAAGPGLAQQAASFRRADGATVPARIYSPTADSCRGIAVISPGAGGSERGLAYLGSGMAAQGYLAVVVGHEESGLRALRQHMRGRGLQQGLARLITDPKAYEARFMDIAAAAHWARARCPAPESVLLGHSMGAATVMIDAGATNKLGVTGTTPFDVYVALSPQGVSTIFPAGAWHGIEQPVLTITGHARRGTGRAAVADARAAVRGHGAGVQVAGRGGRGHAHGPRRARQEHADGATDGADDRAVSRRGARARLPAAAAHARHHASGEVSRPVTMDPGNPAVGGLLRKRSDMNPSDWAIAPSERR